MTGEPLIRRLDEAQPSLDHGRKDPPIRLILSPEHMDQVCSDQAAPTASSASSSGCRTNWATLTGPLTPITPWWSISGVAECAMAAPLTRIGERPLSLFLSQQDGAAGAAGSGWRRIGWQVAPTKPGRVSTA